MADAMVSGHVAGAGLDTESLTMMLDAVREFVEHALSPQRQLQLDHDAVSYTHLRAHETVLDLVCRLLLEKKNTIT